MDVQDRIRRYMAQRGWSEYRLAKEAGLSQSTISNLFRRNNAPTLPTLETLCCALGLSLPQFFTEDTDAVILTDRQKQLFSIWNTLTDEQQRLFLELMQAMRIR